MSGIPFLLVRKYTLLVSSTMKASYFIVAYIVFVDV